MAEPPTSYEAAKEQAEAARRRAIARRNAIADRERMHRQYLRSLLRKHWWQLWKPIDYERLHFPFDVMVDRDAASDTLYRMHIGDVQWFLAWASMYAQGEQHAELREVSRRLSVPVRTSSESARADGPPAPPSQRVQRP